VYIDPPFDVGADFAFDIEVGDETLVKAPTVIEEVAYRDTWGRGADSFVSMLHERLLLVRELLSADGTIYVHMGWGVTHYVRAVMDEVFGKAFAKVELAAALRGAGSRLPTVAQYPPRWWNPWETCSWAAPGRRWR
jgi:hypothetical protein